jgi:hypothetical protein
MSDAGFSSTAHSNLKRKEVRWPNRGGREIVEAVF